MTIWKFETDINSIKLQIVLICRGNEKTLLEANVCLKRKFNLLEILKTDMNKYRDVLLRAGRLQLLLLFVCEILDGHRVGLTTSGPSIPEKK